VINIYPEAEFLIRIATPSGFSLLSDRTISIPFSTFIQ